ncbi:TIGR03032 family protein [[Limnothrix rosea] IAM M-220]|nr:TIGR03032 family protein [[Limnothrix rosea] IAM M-220]
MTSPKTENSAVPEEKTHEPPAVVSCSDSSIFAELLRQLNCSVVITAPSDDQIISLCSVDGHLHSHSRNFAKPGAFWADRARLDLVTQYQLSHFRNMAAVAKKLEPQGTYDACYLHRKGHVIGELFVEDLGYAQGQVWGVSSRFSCLFTIDAPYSFVPRWKPAFLKTLAPNDACHLNGLAIADDVPKYVTALSATSTPQGWRQTALDQGVLIDVDSNEIIAGNLKSPTAPRWYQDKLWLLESTTGHFSVVDLNSGNLEQITQIPGFSRSLTFMGDYAFIAVDNLPTEFEGQAGVWVVDLKAGSIAAHSIFQDIERCHGIQVLPKTMRPDITNFEEVLIGSSYALSQAALKEVAMAK